jgi:HK97 family phage major capsid protein
MNRIQPYDRKRWFQLHCCKSVVKANPLPAPDITAAIGLAMTGILAILALGAMIHLMGGTAIASGGSLAMLAVDPRIAEVRRMAAAIPLGIERKEATAEQQIELEIKKIKDNILDAIRTKADLETVTAMQKQLDALDIKLAERHAGGGGSQPNTLEKLLGESEEFKKLQRDRKGTAILNLKGADAGLLEFKTTIDSAAVGRSTSGVLQIDRAPGIVTEARQRLFLRNVLTSRPTALGDLDFIKVNSPMSRASMQTESSAKMEQAMTFTTGTARVQTIAHWIPASKQILEDATELASAINDSLLYWLGMAEEVQFLTGSGTGQDLNGLVTQATAFNTALHTYTPGWKKGDIIARVRQQIAIAKEIDPTFIVLHPTDYWDIRLTKDTTGNYLDKEGLFWELTPIVTTAIGAGSFLIGSGNPDAAIIRDRMEAQIEVSNSHDDYFTRNLVAIRAEKRVALVVRRPGSYVTGTFNNSPA